MDSGNRAESLGGNRSEGRERKLLAEKFYHRVEGDDQDDQGDQGGKDDQDDQDGGENFHWPEKQARKPRSYASSKLTSTNLMTF